MGISTHVVVMYICRYP